MAAISTITSNTYGKSRVRVVRIDRQPNIHHIFEVSVTVLLRGPTLAEGYITGSNATVVPTDTMKNTVYYIAKTGLKSGQPIERFGQTLGRHFLATYGHIDTVTISMEQSQWERQINPVNGSEQKHAFIKRQGELRTATVVSYRGGKPVEVTSGIANLIVLKTHGSGFEGFPVCKLTTLPPTKDRLLCTNVKSEWSYDAKAIVADNIDYCGIWTGVKNTFLERFSNYYSKSVQQTVYDVGTEAIAKFSSINQITLKLPNIHYFHYDIKRFGLENQDEVYFPMDDPSGYIEGTISRTLSKL